ncbi:zinc finger protein 787 [Plutella xylostella]|uniref:zinc finger protein 787 n=1 Tax=Plutella xylostella TaxID=51655 RepID=UPI002033095D|nr:zinc finger protein 787 [Plutella xylostella]
MCSDSEFVGCHHRRRASSLTSTCWSAMGVEARASMPAAAERARSPSPGHQCKRRRLSRLLDKLAVQLRRQCPPPAWLRPPAPAPAPAPAPDAPLDLTVRAAPPPPPPPRHACPDCGQAFALQDRLAKHVASRHRGRTPDAARAYVCDVCQRRFARSDMLTRHARLHSGVKPYACGACGQVFSRSDHLATHQRTHTGEKPYRCPACPYAACRRDMITRHMRTHARRAPPA